MNKKESELLNITLEECAEVVQAISKVFRFGWDSCHPNEPYVTNKMHLEEEIGDLVCMIRLLEDRGIIDPVEVETAVHNKRKKLAKWSSIEQND